MTAADAIAEQERDAKAAVVRQLEALGDATEAALNRVRLGFRPAVGMIRRKVDAATEAVDIWEALQEAAERARREAG
jgi:hypothetical protein